MSKIETELKTSIESSASQIKQIKVFINARYDDIRYMVTSTNERMRNFVNTDRVSLMESSFRAQLHKYEEDVDSLQNFMRDMNNKFTDCRTRLLKQIEFNTEKGQELASQINGAPSESMVKLEEKVNGLSASYAGFAKQVSSCVETIETQVYTREQIDEQRAELVTHQQLQDALPDMRQHRIAIEKVIVQSASDLESRFMTTFKTLDGKIVAIRKDVNMDGFKLLISKKADLTPTTQTLDQHTDTLATHTTELAQTSEKLKSLK